MNNFYTLLNQGKFKEALLSAEKEVYAKAYIQNNFNQTATAKAINVARGTFITKMKHWGKL